MEVAEKLGRFGHHPDPAIDFCTEVESIESMVHDLIATGRCRNDDDSPSSWQTLTQRIDRAMDFRVGGDLGAICAKRGLRLCEATLVEWCFEMQTAKPLGSPKKPDPNAFIAAVIATYPSADELKAWGRA